MNFMRPKAAMPMVVETRRAHWLHRDHPKAISRPRTLRRSGVLAVWGARVSLDGPAVSIEVRSPSDLSSAVTMFALRDERVSASIVDCYASRDDDPCPELACDAWRARAQVLADALIHSASAVARADGFDGVIPGRVEGVEPLVYVARGSSESPLSALVVSPRRRGSAPVIAVLIHEVLMWRGRCGACSSCRAEVCH